TQRSHRPWTPRSPNRPYDGTANRRQSRADADATARRPSVSSGGDAGARGLRCGALWLPDPYDEEQQRGRRAVLADRRGVLARTAAIRGAVQRAYLAVPVGEARGGEPSAVAVERRPPRRLRGPRRMRNGC